MTRLLSILLLALCSSAFGQNVTNLVAGQRLWAGMQLTTVYASGCDDCTNLVANPGFETGDLTSWTSDGFISSGVNGDYPHTGSYSLWLFDSLSASVSQPINTTTGLTYQISFWLIGSDSVYGSPGLVVSWGTNTLYNITNWTSGDFVLFSTNAIAVTNQTALKFTQYNGYGFDLDDVSVIHQ